MDQMATETNGVIILMQSSCTGRWKWLLVSEPDQNQYLRMICELILKAPALNTWEQVQIDGEEKVMKGEAEKREGKNNCG